VVNVSPSKTLFIRSETLIQNSNYESLVGKNDTTDILLQIPIQTSFNTYINYTDQSSDLWAEINNSIIDKVNLYISDSTSSNELPSDSGLLNWFVQVNIQEIYRETDINTDHITDNLVSKTNNLQVIDDLVKQKNDLEAEIKAYYDKKKNI
jgi:hypothetical protein